METNHKLEIGWPPLEESNIESTVRLGEDPTLTVVMPQMATTEVLDLSITVTYQELALFIYNGYA